MVVALALVQALAGTPGTPPRPLPGNEPCAYPSAAAQKAVTGPVSFVARVTPDGSTESVEIRAVPVPDLGFEEAVRSCVASWRFEPAAAGDAGPRTFESTVRFRISPENEAAIRQILESLAAAWNTGDEPGLEELETRDDELPWLPSQGRHFLQQEVREASGDRKCRLRLESDVSRLRFFAGNLAQVAQPFSCVPAAGAVPSSTSIRTLDLMVAKGPRGWRFATISEEDWPWFRASRVGGEIREPRKVKHVSPEYPRAARDARVQGVIILECVIAPEGHVSDIRVLRGIPLLDKAAIDAVRQWVYTPTLLEGQPVPVIMTVTVNFRLK
jgi:TonB family protein